LQVIEREFFEERFAVMGELDQDLAAIIGGTQAAEISPVHQPIDQLDRAVVLQLHAFGQNADRRFEAVGQPSYGQEQLVLLRLDAGLARGMLAETEKPADLVAQFRHSFEIGRGLISGHKSIA
jgi:hypothetical protein